MTSTEGEIGRTYSVELLFDRVPDWDAPSVVRAIQEQCPHADVSGSGLSVFHTDAMVALKDGSVAAQTAILGPSEPFGPDHFEPSLHQSWNWPQAREALGSARAQIRVFDLMSSGLQHQKRLQIFQGTLFALTRTLRPIAIHWASAQKFVRPEEFSEAMVSVDETDRVFVAMNVRLFNIADRPGETVMDTFGLGSLMLPDLQVHFRGLNPDAVARHLYNSGVYIFDNGDVIADGHTIQGLTPKQKWRCHHQAALVGPDREVLDLDPGPKYAVGGRGSNSLH